jgi:hypothetical protein
MCADGFPSDCPVRVQASKSCPISRLLAIAFLVPALPLSTTLSFNGRQLAPLSYSKFGPSISWLFCFLVSSSPPRFHTIDATTVMMGVKNKKNPDDVHMIGAHKSKPKTRRGIKMVPKSAAAAFFSLLTNGAISSGLRPLVDICDHSCVVLRM